METLTKQVEAVRVEERPAVLKKALLIAHSITGTSATYGFNEISAAAHAMELYLKNFNGTVLESNNQIEAAGLLDKLQQEVETARQTAPTTQWHY
jgi:chemotaxis protein histidine kinase CheA